MIRKASASGFIGGITVYQSISKPIRWEYQEIPKPVERDDRSLEGDTSLLGGQ